MRVKCIHRCRRASSCRSRVVISSTAAMPLLESRSLSGSALVYADPYKLSGRRARRGRATAAPSYHPPLDVAPGPVRTPRLARGAPPHPPQRPDADRPEGLRRRARVLLRDLPPRQLLRAGHLGGDGAGQPLPLGLRASSVACTSRSAPARRSSCAAPAGRSSTSWSTCAAARRRSASGRASSSATRTCASPTSRSGSRTGSACCPTIADVMYKQSGYYAGETERGIAFDDPEVGIEWPVPEADRQFSERDATAPRLREIADALPFTYARA